MRIHGRPRERSPLDQVPTLMSAYELLRSSVAPQIDRHEVESGQYPRPDKVAILGHPKGRPPLVEDVLAAVVPLVAILGHPESDRHSLLAW